MKIVLLSPEYPPDIALGGIATHTETTAHALVDRGHDVTVVTNGMPSTTSERGVRVIRLAHSRLPAFFPRRDVVQRVLAQLRIAWTCRRLRPDVVHAAEWQAQAWLITRLNLLPVVTRLATPTFVLNELNLDPPDQTTVVRWMERDQAQRSRFVYAPTRAISRVVARRWAIPEDDVVIVANPLDLGAVRSWAALDPPFPMAGRSIVFNGRLERRKGIATLGPALASVLAKHPDVEAVLIGRQGVAHDSDLLRNFRDAIEDVADRVKLVGELPQSSALSVVARATVVALPSLWESFGYACVEAMALGRAVVASGRSGFEEIVTHGENGLLVPPGDAEALAEALIEILGDDAKRQRLGAAAARRAEDFDARSIALEIEAVTSRCADPRPSSRPWGRGQLR